MGRTTRSRSWVTSDDEETRPRETEGQPNSVAATEFPHAAAAHAETHVLDGSRSLHQVRPARIHLRRLRRRVVLRLQRQSACRTRASAEGASGGDGSGTAET